MRTGCWITCGHDIFFEISFVRILAALEPSRSNHQLSYIPTIACRRDVVSARFVVRETTCEGVLKKQNSEERSDSVNSEVQLFSRSYPPPRPRPSRPRRRARSIPRSGTPEWRACHRVDLQCMRSSESPTR